MRSSYGSARVDCLYGATASLLALRASRRTVKVAVHDIGGFVWGPALNVRQAAGGLDEVDQRFESAQVVREVAPGIQAAVSEKLLAAWDGGARNQRCDRVRRAATADVRAVRTRNFGRVDTNIDSVEKAKLGARSQGGRETRWRRGGRAKSGGERVGRNPGQAMCVRYGGDRQKNGPAKSHRPRVFVFGVRRDQADARGGPETAGVEMQRTVPR